MIVKEADASESSGSLTKATTGDVVTVNPELFLIREGILTSQTPYLEILDIIEEFLNILIIFEDEKTSELEFIETFNASKISDVNNLIITLETNFDKFINSNSNLITSEDNVFIENFLEKIRKLYKILNLCTILFTKISDKNELQARNITLTEPLDKTNYDDRHKDLFNGPISTLKSVGIETNFISPIGYMTKKELYEMLPKEVREMVITCSYPWKFDMQECGKCNKCIDLVAVKKACEEW